MDPRFFRSREFVVSLAVALVLLGGVAVAATQGLDLDRVLTRGGCEIDPPPGATRQGQVNDSGVVRRNDRVERVVTHTLGDDAFGPVSVLACTKVGDVEVLPWSGDQVQVRFTMLQHGPGAAEALEDPAVEAAFAVEGDRLHVRAWQPRTTSTQTWFWERSWSSTTVEIMVPTGHSTSLDLRTDVGDITLASLPVSEAAVSTDVGDVDLQGIDLRGDLDVRTDVGDVRLDLGAVQNATLSVRTDVGSLDVQLPETPRTGYQVEASTDVGDVRVDLGPGQTSSADRDGPSSSVEARSAGWDQRPVRVHLALTTDVGDIEVGLV